MIFKLRTTRWVVSFQERKESLGREKVEKPEMEKEVGAFVKKKKKEKRIIEEIVKG